MLSFADDTTVYLSGPYSKVLFDTVNIELTKLFDWLCANSLSLNIIEKTNMCIVCPSGTNYNVGNNHITLNGKQINCVGETNKDHSIKLLGMYLDKHLTWNNHVNIISSKLSKALFIINRVKHLLPWGNG